MLLAALGMLAQITIVAPADTQGETDERAARDARSAQQRFERYRRANLPRRPGGGGVSRCDAHIGRFCYWYDSTATDVVPEPPRIGQARLALLATLDSVAARSPEDAWIAGQRVRYLLEAGRGDEALRAARSCRADRWWCLALTGLVHHVTEGYVAADSAFDAALRAMPEDQRCEWLDIGIVADARWRRTLRTASCERRATLADIAFTMGRPLWMVAGDDLRSEHFARHTMALVYERSANAYSMSFGWDSRELMLRYGWPEWYTREDLTVSALPTIAVTGHDREPTYYFLPDVARLDDVVHNVGAWKLREAGAPTRYAPRHVTRLTSLPHQLDRFPRGDSLLLVATFRVADSVLERDRARSVLAAYRANRVTLLARGGPRDRTLSAMAPNDTMVVSVEVLGDSSRHASRARYTLLPLSCSGGCVSDLLIVDPRKVDSTATPVDAARGAYFEGRITGNAPVGIFFELGGDTGARPRPATFALTLTPVRVSAARRLASTLRLARRPEPVRMRWQEVVGPDREARVIVLHLPASARGRYRLQLTITGPGGDRSMASRELEIVR